MLVKKIILGFENCDTMELDARDVDIRMEDFAEKIAYLKANCEFQRYKVVNSITIKIMNSAIKDKTFYEFGRKDYNDLSMLDRLFKKDIAYISFAGNDKTKTYYVAWEDSENDETVNRLERVSQGNSYLRIDIEKKGV